VGLGVEFVLVPRVLDSVALLKAQVEPEARSSQECCSPGHPDVERSFSVNQVACALTVLVRQYHLGEQDANGQPSEATLNRLVLAQLGAPGHSVDVDLSMADCAKGKPEEQTRNWEEVFRLDHQGVHHEEAIEEV